MAKDKEEKKSEPAPSKGKGGCVKKLLLLLVVLSLVYLGSHIYFLFQPAGKGNTVTDALSDSKVFPAVQPYTLDHVAGRSEILKGTGAPGPMLKERVANAIKNKFPITFREEEINAWLSKRVEIKQGGATAPFATARGVWVNFTQDEIEVIIERELEGGGRHSTSMFLKFERSKQGFTILPHASRIGQVRAPGGFARLIKPSFDHLLTELAEEMKLYKDIHDIKVEDGRITLDPRRPEERK